MCEVTGRSFTEVVLETQNIHHSSLVALLIADTTLYLVVGVVVYAFAGAHTVSPALVNTGHTLRRVAYGVALPTIVVAGVINAHVCAKLDGGWEFVTAYVEPHAEWWVTWIGIWAGIWALAFVMAEVYVRPSYIPFFNDLQGVISSLFASWFTYGISICLSFSLSLIILWFHLNPCGTWWTTTSWKLQMVFWGAIVLAGTFIMVAGLYACIYSIVKGYRRGSFQSPFSCVNRALA
ncbi:hypothetical protein NEOLEDRAFT_1181373 [Neolentinus lepideus HHB14362 ss-1]|uniref:Uncharacterized protein n=1 Tax=Neolentinus lepideus HHB14362 ss-1 TaxID=1314782 RepID=A0A165Q2S2_9AGAM|nr:hypothetical protein NEOLEDRAFT_1181373 [Neolentinus lepideus HHB14362 ss-1]